VQVSWTAPNANGAAISSTVAPPSALLLVEHLWVHAQPAGQQLHAHLADQWHHLLRFTAGSKQPGLFTSFSPEGCSKPGAASTTSLSMSAVSALSGASVSLTATVTSGATGTVNFKTGWRLNFRAAMR